MAVVAELVVVPEATPPVTGDEPDVVSCSGEEDPTELGLDGEPAAGVPAAGDETVWVMAWLVVKTEVCVSVTGQIVVETATTTVVVASWPWPAGQSVTVEAQEVIVW